MRLLLVLVVLHVCPDTFLQSAHRLNHKRRFNPVAPHCTRLRHTGTAVTAGCIKQRVVDCFERGAERWEGWIWTLTTAVIPVKDETWPRLNTSRVDARRAGTAQLPLPLDAKPPADPARKNTQQKAVLRAVYICNAVD